MIRVYLVGGSSLAVEGLAALVQSDPEIEVIARFDDLSGNEETLSQAIAEENPDVVILEIGPGQEKMALRRLAAEEIFSEAAIVVLGGDADSAFVSDAIRFGARAVLEADASGAQLSAAVHAVAEGLMVLPGGAKAFSRGQTSIESAASEELEPLTAREREVLNLMASGLGNKQIAAKLGISEHTSKFHVASILGKLGATTRTEAVAIGARNGLVLL